MIRYFEHSRFCSLRFRNSKIKFTFDILVLEISLSIAGLNYFANVCSSGRNKTD